MAASVGECGCGRRSCRTRRWRRRSPSTAPPTRSTRSPATGSARPTSAPARCAPPSRRRTSRAAGRSTSIPAPTCWRSSRTVRCRSPATGDLDVYGELTISGGGADKTIVDGGGIDRVFAMQVASRVTISDVTVRNGQAQPGDDGGGIVELRQPDARERHGQRQQDAQSDATLSADAPGGGIFNAATLQLRNCTITGNTAADIGGGIHNKGILTMLQSTIANNTADGRPRRRRQQLQQGDDRPEHHHRQPGDGHRRRHRERRRPDAHPLDAQRQHRRERRRHPQRRRARHDRLDHRRQHRAPDRRRHAATSTRPTR